MSKISNKTKKFQKQIQNSQKISKQSTKKIQNS